MFIIICYRQRIARANDNLENVAFYNSKRNVKRMKGQISFRRSKIRLSNEVIDSITVQWVSEIVEVEN